MRKAAADSRRRLDGCRFRPNVEVLRSIASFCKGLIGGGASGNRLALFDTLVISISVLGFNRVPRS